MVHLTGSPSSDFHEVLCGVNASNQAWLVDVARMATGGFDEAIRWVMDIERMLQKVSVGS